MYFIVKIGTSLLDIDHYLMNWSINFNNTNTSPILQVTLYIDKNIT